eukprot:jgi/Mesen1/2986/ME000176S02024
MEGVAACAGVAAGIVSVPLGSIGISGTICSQCRSCSITLPRKLAHFTGLRSEGRVPLGSSLLSSTYSVKSRHGLRSQTTSVRASSSNTPSVQESKKKVDFGPERELSGTQGLVKSLPPPLRYAVCAAIIAGAAGIGAGIGGRAVGRLAAPRVGQVAGAVVLGAAGAGAAHVLNASVDDVAAADLHNLVVRHSDPENLPRDQVDSIVKKYGVKPQDPKFNEELRNLYDRFVTEIIPPGNENLRGDEAESIVRFKQSLGLEDDDAANVHIEIGRRMFRQRMETGDKEMAVQERRAFQKLVYVSHIVFGEASKFLLPWKRVFKVTDSQVDVAMRDNAQRLFQVKIDENNGEALVDKLRDLKAYQLKFKLSDDLAAEMFVEAATKRAEKFVAAALEVLKARSRVKDLKKVVGELDALRAYNRALADVASQASADEIVPGVGPVVVTGGSEGNRAMDDLKLLYRTYLGEALSTKKLNNSQMQALAELRNAFGLGTKEGEAINAEVTRKVYRAQLAQAFTSGDLERAASKASFLEELCDNLCFDPDQAAQVHEEIYRQKLSQCLEDKELSDDDMAALQRVRIFLCIPQAVVDAAHAESCGAVFAKVVDEAVGAGMQGYDLSMKKAVQTASKGLRLPPATALEIAGKAVRRVFLAYVKRAQGSGSRMEAARELKKMIIFSNRTVSELLDDMRGGKPEQPKPEEEKKREEEERRKREEEEEDLEEDKVRMLQSLRKTRGPSLEGRPQKEISLRDDLELRERQDLYKTYLLYCIQGDSAGLAMGSSIVVKRDDSEFVRLGQLGDLLGMAPMEQAGVHQGLAEEAFKSQAQTLLADGQLSKKRAEQLKALQKQLGLPDAAAQKVVQGITSTKMAGAIDQAVQQGRLSVDDIRELKASGVDITAMVNNTVRTNLYKRLVEKALSTGTGDFSRAEVLDKLPEDLGLDREKMGAVVSELARERLKGGLVQAVSLLRQRKSEQVVETMYNMLACDKAERSPEPLAWAVKEELFDLYGLFLADKDASEEKKDRMRELLSIDDAQAASIAEMVQQGGFAKDAHEDQFVF